MSYMYPTPHFGPPPGHPSPPHGHHLPPVFPPPHFEPPIPAHFVNPRAISHCLFRNTFVWLNNGNRFWFFPTSVGFATVSGFWWTGRFWLVFVLPLREIRSFTCF
ncbi:transporter [Paenibacillus cremeus]|uniref:Transporter n=1 Tax=Paenibacillus cremeus TaxID=2163881 RepID=A0A559K5T5_9BACL|nr:transporter [Paenibacillus cremeus]